MGRTAKVAGNSGHVVPFVWWIPVAAVLIASLYAPSLRARFDFIDDGNLVYANGPMPFAQRLDILWMKIEGNYESLGPFRPVLWAHWELFAELNQESELAWRATRLAWCVLSAAMLLWLMSELGVAPWACVIATASAIWNPFRSEIWTSNTLAEGVAMPYALFALVAARKASTSVRPWLWDVVGALGVLAALGCKNTFAALVPAQMFLRIAQDGLSLRECWRCYRVRACLLSATLIFPIAHLIYFKLHWHPGQYQTMPPSLANLLLILTGYRGGISLDLLGAGLAFIMLLTLIVHRRRLSAGPWSRTVGDFGAQCWNLHKTALVAAILLIGAGIAIYLPIGAMSGRYVMPGIWGLDILVGLLLTRFMTIVPSSTARRAAWTVLGIGLTAVAVANLGKQERHIARTKMLWDALEWVECHASPKAKIAWCGGNLPTSALNLEEGIHFAWHLGARNKSSVTIALCDERGALNERTREVGDVVVERFDYRIVGPVQAKQDPCWQDECRFVHPYRVGLRRHECVLQRDGSLMPTCGEQALNAR